MTNPESKDVGESLAEIIDSFLSEVHTCMPGKVTAFDADTQTVSVQPCIMKKFLGATGPVQLPIIEDVPVVYPGSGDTWIVFPVAVDSYVLLVFSERSIARWMTSGDIVDPGTERHHKLSDAIAIPGILPGPAQLSSPVETGTIAIRNEDGTTYVKVDAARNVVLNDGTDTAIAYSRMKTAFDQLVSDFNALRTAFNAHVHANHGVPPTAVPGSIPSLLGLGSPSTADMTSAKSDTVKVP